MASVIGSGRIIKRVIQKGNVYLELLFSNKMLLGSSQILQAIKRNGQK